MKNLCSTQYGGFQFLLILDLWDISFHPVVVFGLGKDFLFKSILGLCVYVPMHICKVRLLWIRFCNRKTVANIQLVMELHRFCTATQLKVTRTLGWPTSPILILETIWYNPLAFTKYFFKICWLKAVFVLKVAFIQKGLMRLSFLQTDEPNYFPELELWIFSF